MINLLIHTLASIKSPKTDQSEQHTQRKLFYFSLASGVHLSSVWSCFLFPTSAETSVASTSTDKEDTNNKIQLSVKQDTQHPPQSGSTDCRGMGREWREPLQVKPIVSKPVWGNILPLGQQTILDEDFTCTFSDSYRKDNQAQPNYSTATLTILIRYQLQK